MEGVTISLKNKCIVVESKTPLRTLSSGIFGGYKKTSTILNAQVPHDYKGTPEDDLREAADHFGIKSFVGMMTAVDVENHFLIETEDVVCICTAGFTNTVNIILVLNAALTIQGMVNAVIVACEAKTAAFHDLDVRESVTEFLTGTVTDSLVVAVTDEGHEEKYCGRATPLGETIYETVKRAVFEALQKHEKLQPEREISERLAERGIYMKDLVEAEMELFIENDKISQEDFRSRFEEELNRILQDINISSLILGALRLEEDGRKGLIPLLSREEFVKDPIHLVSDEILGTAVAAYIGGTLATFEFSRVERVKPGILGEIGPFLDDVLGGLLAGVSSKIFCEAGP